MSAAAMAVGSGGDSAAGFAGCGVGVSCADAEANTDRPANNNTASHPPRLERDPSEISVIWPNLPPVPWQA
jgi:hypothetical protein